MNNRNPPVTRDVSNVLPDESVQDIVMVDHLEGHSSVTSGCSISINARIHGEEVVAHVDEAKVLVPHRLKVREWHALN